LEEALSLLEEALLQGVHPSTRGELKITSLLSLNYLLGISYTTMDQLPNDTVHCLLACLQWNDVLATLFTCKELYSLRYNRLYVERELSQAKRVLRTIAPKLARSMGSPYECVEITTTDKGYLDRHPTVRTYSKHVAHRCGNYNEILSYLLERGEIPQYKNARRTASKELAQIKDDVRNYRQRAY
jgi:hypothetical protein